MDIKNAQHDIPSSLRSTLVETDSMNPSRTRLIIGIDFGTTLSKAAFALLSKNKVHEGIITGWPGAGIHSTKQDIPTTIYYDQRQNVVGWGLDTADALGPLGYPKPGVQRVDWFKLHLTTPESAHPLPPGKSEIDVIADYLLKMRQAVHGQVQKILGDAFDRDNSIHYYLAVPAFWNDATKASIRMAATQAGLLKTENNNDQLTLITGTRATAMYYVKSAFSDFKTGGTILIVDCGGGIVDLAAYEVNENPFTLTECTASSSDSCGSTELNRNFANIVRARVRKIGPRLGRIFSKCTRDFENRIKAEFRRNGQKWHIDIGTEPEFNAPEVGIEDGYMIFTNEDILQCFVPVVNCVSELVRNHISAIQKQGRLLEKVLFVGGFSTSEYLFNEIKQHMPPQFQPLVTRLMNSPSATVQGAVMTGIEQHQAGRL